MAVSVEVPGEKLPVFIEAAEGFDRTVIFRENDAFEFILISASRGGRCVGRPAVGYVGIVARRTDDGRTAVRRSGTVGLGFAADAPGVEVVPPGLLPHAARIADSVRAIRRSIAASFFIFEYQLRVAPGGRALSFYGHCFYPLANGSETSPSGRSSSEGFGGLTSITPSFGWMPKRARISVMMFLKASRPAPCR